VLSSDGVEPKLTVIVCTFNRASKLPVSLNALAGQTARDQIQVVVVDDGSNDDTADVAQKYSVDFLRLEVNQGASAARNAGIARARAEFVAFTDDDVEVPPDWAERLIGSWERLDPRVTAFGGEVTVAQPNSFTQRYLVSHMPLAPLEIDIVEDAGFLQRLRSYFRSASHTHGGVRPVYSVVGANMSFRKSALESIGKFDSSIRFGGDEVYVCKKLHELFGPETVVCDASLKVAHHFEPGLADTLRRAYLYGRAGGRDFARAGGIPPVRPTSALSALICVSLVPNHLLVGVASGLVIPYAVWRVWPREAFQERRPSKILYPLVALLEEHVNNLGLVFGWWKEQLAIREFKKTKLSEEK